MMKTRFPILIILSLWAYSLWGQLDLLQMPIAELEAAADQFQPGQPELTAIWNELGFKYYDQGNLAQAETYALKAQSQAFQNGNLAPLSYSWVVLGHVARDRGHFEQAESYYQQALDIRRKENNYRGIASCLNSLGVLCLDDENQYENGITYLQQALEALSDWPAEEADKRSLRAKVYLNLGDLQCKLGQEENANKSFEQARSLARGELLGDLLINQGNCRLQQGSYRQARNQFARALSIFREAGNERKIAKAYLQLHAGAFMENELDTALHYWKEAYALKENLDTTEQGILLKNRGSLYKANGNNEKALEYYRQAQATFEALGNQEELAMLHFDMGDIHYQKKEYRSALSELEQSRGLLSTMEIPGLDNDLSVLLEAASEQKRLYDSRLLIALVLFLLLIVATAMVYLSYQRRQLAEYKVWDTQQRLGNALRELERERNYQQLEDSERLLNWISKELHDRLGGMLSTIKLYMDNLNQKLDLVQAENKAQFEKANSLLDEVCEEVRRISRGAKPANLPNRGLEKELKHLLDYIRSTQQIEVEYSAYGMKQRLPINQEMKLYRIINILINNILTHSGASWFSVQINRFSDQLNIMIEDNGKGIDLDALKNSKGTGIKNMYSLCAELGASAHFDTEMKRGAAVSIDMPILNTITNQKAIAND